MWAHLILVFNFYHLTNENIEITYMICFLQRVNMSKKSFKYLYTESIHLNIYMVKVFFFFFLQNKVYIQSSNIFATVRWG